MSSPRGPVRWLHALGLGRPRPDESVEMEIDHHLAELVDRLVEQGLSREHALRVASERFGHRGRYVPAMRRMERWTLARSRFTAAADLIRQTMLAVVRGARRHPAYTLGVIATLGLGLGTNATMYGVVDRLLLRPPEHLVQPERLRNVFINRPNTVTGSYFHQAAFTYPDYQDLLAHSRMSVAAYEASSAIVGVGTEAAMVQTLDVTASFFPLLGVRPHLGRFFTEEEARPGSPLTAVLSYELWQREYGADPDIIGRSIQIGDDAIPVIGIAPQGFTGVSIRRVDVLRPLEATVAHGGGETTLTGRGYYFAQVVARLADGVDAQSAEEEATRLHRTARGPEIQAGRYPPTASLTLAPLRANSWETELTAESRVAGWLMGVSLMVLLIACANVANLLISRLTVARREIAVRLALGIGRRRLVAQTVLESTVLALLGGVFALAIARWGGALVRTRLLTEFTFPDSPVSGRVVAFTVGISLMAGLLAGLGPALRGTRADVAPDLSASGRTHSARRSRARDALTAAQAAMSVVLLVGAGLFVGSLMELRRLDLGLDLDHVITTQFVFAGAQPDVEERRDFFALAARRVESLPEVEAVAATATPFSTTYAIGLRVPGLDSLPRFPAGGPYIFSVTPGYFRTTGLSIVRGRPLLDSDGRDDELVTVVSETMARALWPDGDPLGRCLMIGSDPSGCTTVVGVVEDASRGGYDQSAYMGYYVPLAQATALPQEESLSGPTSLYLRVRDRRDADAVVAAATPILIALAPEVRWVRAQSLRDQLDPEARSWTLGAAMFIAFGLLAATLSAIGLYAVLAFEVAQRSRELGIRVALGAERPRLLRAVVYRGLSVAAVGIAAGLAIAYLVAPYVQGLLFQVSPREPTVLAGVAALLAVVSLAASLLPGLRATRVDPMTALKAD